MSAKGRIPESYWLNTASELFEKQPSLAGDAACDIAIVGGGFVGLWTSIFIKQLEPDASVVLLEKGRCGHGASGMNGGFVISWWPKIVSLAQACGLEDALWLANETSQSVTAIGSFLRDNQLDADFVERGWIWAASMPAHLGCWRGVLERVQSLDRGDIFVELNSKDIAERTGSSVHVGGILEKQGAIVHPAKLVKGLATVAKKLGVKIYENSPVVDFTRTQPSVLTTSGGRLVANKVILATNVWSTRIRELGDYIFPVTSSIVATEPIPERLEKIGWTGGEGIIDSQWMVNYYRPTRDGRIAFGKGGGSNLYAGRDVPPLYHAEAIGRATSEFRRIYPMLADVKIEQSWTGPIDRTYSGLPLLGRFKTSPNIAYGVGWSGNGVNPSRVGGRILASLALDRKDRWSENGLINAEARAFPPEPLRYLGGKLVRSAMSRKDRADLTGTSISMLDKALISLAPAGIEDKTSQ